MTRISGAIKLAVAISLVATSGCDGRIKEPNQDPAARGAADGRRLTRTEYFNSIEVVLGVELDPDEFSLPRDNRIPEGFRNSSAQMLLSPARIEAYDLIAATAVERIDIDALVADHAACVDESDQCMDGFVASLGLKVLRRPPPIAEVAAYRPLFARAIEEGEGFAAGARLVLRAMLQSPRFLYRLETPASDKGERVDEFELATRLSFLVWNAAPDAELLALADGRLREELDSQVARLLAHPRAHRAFRQYLEQWLYLDAIPDGFPLRADLKEETYRLFDSIAWDEDVDLMSAFKAQRTFLSAELADFYGYESLGSGVQEYDLSERPERVGFLTHAGVLTARTINPSTSMIDRGLFVLNDLFCSTVPPPEGEALGEAIEEETVPESSELSQRERFARQSQNPLCRGCHGEFDPLGLAFENFDGVGRYVLEDQYGNALTGAGEVNLDGALVKYADIGEFALALAESESVARCLAAKSLQHAWGRFLEPTDVDAVDAVYKSFSNDGRTYRALIRAIATHSDFDFVKVTR